MSNQIVISSGAKVRELEGVLTGTSGVVNSLGINVPSGIPQLDASGKILVSQLPNSVMEYKGTWNAATNTPTLADGTGNQGDVYLCNVAGTVNFGSGPIAFFVGDQVIYSGTIWQRASGATGTVTSVSLTESGDSLNITGSPITTSGTINIGFNGDNTQYINGAGNLTTFPSLAGYVPYTGATTNVNLGTFDLSADAILGATGSFISNGSANTFDIEHSSGSGIALSIVKEGNNEGLYVEKTSGSGNAATIIGTLTATTLVKSGGTSSQFLKADGSIDSSTYLTTSAAASTYVPYTGATQSVNLGAYGLIASALNVTNTSTLDGNILLKKAGIAVTTPTYVTQFAATTGVGIGYSDGTGGGNFVFSTAAIYNYTFPAITGTLALLEGFQTFTGIKTFDEGLSLKSGAYPTPATGYSSIGGNPFGITVITKQSSTIYTSDFGFPTANRTFIFPNADGTIALTSDLGAYLPLAGGTLTGALSGTSATFSGLTLSSASTPLLQIVDTTNSKSLLFGADDSNTFIRSSSSTPILFQVNGGDTALTLASNQAATFSSSVTAVGTSAIQRASSGASTILQFKNEAGANRAKILFGGSVEELGFYAGDGTSEAMRITSGGNVGIGTSSPNSALQVGAFSGNNAITIGGATDGVSSLYFGDGTGAALYRGFIEYQHNGDFMRIGTDGTERMRITSGGSVLIGTTSNVGQKLRVYQPTNGEWNIKLIQPNSSSINYQEFLTTTDGDASNTARGSITYNGTNVLYNGTSDYRMKEDLQEFDGLNIISQLKSYDFKWKEAGTRDYGMMAHELQEILPNYVTGQKDELNQDGSIKPQGVDYSKIVPILVKAIQEQQAQIEELKALINK